MRYLIVFFLLCSSLVSAGDGDLLEPEQAFKFSARAVDGQTLEVRYKIAEGYYLYKDKFKFQAVRKGDTAVWFFQPCRNAASVF